jgi:hypothetical protein
MKKFKNMIQVLFMLVVLAGIVADAKPTDQDKLFYRNLNLSIRKTGAFMIPMPGLQKTEFSYNLEFDKPLWPLPLVNEMPTRYSDPKFFFYRLFYDKIFLKEGSSLQLNGEEIPLTCVFVDGLDNRNNGNPSPLFPQFVMKVYLVANSFSCQGPIRPGWPESGGKEEAWDTYLYFEVHDPTIMLPVEIKLRYRWNEFEAVLLDGGGQR